MNLPISKKQIGITFLVILLLGALSFGAYFLFLKPVDDKLERKQDELKMASQELEIIENTLRQSSEKIAVSSMELQKKVPVKRLLDQLLLNIEKAEIISDTNIIELKLNGTQADEEIVFEQNENGEAEETSTDTEETDTSDSKTEAKEILPKGIKKISITVSGEAATYFELEKFISSLQNLKRIVKVEELKFTGLNEIYSVEQTDEVVEFELTLASYYFPSLEDLRNELPPLDVPAVANKKNPLSSFPEIEKKEKEDNEK